MIEEIGLPRGDRCGLHRGVLRIQFRSARDRFRRGGDKAEFALAQAELQPEHGVRGILGEGFLRDL